MKKLIILTAVILIFIASCGVSEKTESADGVFSAQRDESSADAVKNDINIVALGDSITRGYGLDDPLSQCYPSLLKTMLKPFYNNINVSNYAIDGFQSGDLIELLEQDGAPEIKNADIILLCIGANNILQYGYDLLNGIGFGAMDILTDYQKYMLGLDGYEDVPERLGALIKTLNDNAGEDVFAHNMENGIAALRENIPRIIELIKARNAGAEIIYLNIYNPYKNINITFPEAEGSFGLSGLTDFYVRQLNVVIAENSGEGYKVADIYTLFEEKGQKNVNAEFDFAKFLFNYDPHPNLAGQMLIAEELSGILAEE